MPSWKDLEKGLDSISPIQRGGSGSGNYGHSGRPGQRGGSGPGFTNEQASGPDRRDAPSTREANKPDIGAGDGRTPHPHEERINGIAAKVVGIKFDDDSAKGLRASHAALKDVRDRLYKITTVLRERGDLSGHVADVQIGSHLSRADDLLDKAENGIPFGNYRAAALRSMQQAKKELVTATGIIQSKISRVDTEKPIFRPPPGHKQIVRD